MADSITYIKNTKYQFIIIKIIHNSPINVEKIGLVIYKMTFEINIINEENINLLLHSNSDLIESKANIGFLTILGTLCFLYSTNNDIKEKGKIEGKQKAKIYKIKNIECIPLYPFSSIYQINSVIKEFNKIKNILIEEGFYFSTFPIRLDKEMKGQIKFFKNNNNIYKLFEDFQYNYNFAPISLQHFITPLIKGYHKTFSYNITQIEKASMSLTIRNKMYKKNVYLMEIELFKPPTQNNQEIFQIIFYAYFNNSVDKIEVLQELADKWINFLKSYSIKSYHKLGLIINFNTVSKDSNYEETKNLSDFEVYNLNKIKNLENTLNKFNESFKTIGYNYKNNNVEQEIQKRLLILMSDDFENLFSAIEIVASIFFSIFLQDRNYKTNIVNTNKDEIIKRFKAALNKLKIKEDENITKINEINESNYNLFNKNNINEINEENKIKEDNSDNIENNIIEEKETNNKSIKIFIGTYNVNALESYQIKTINLSSFIFPEDMNEFFTEKNMPTFYCIGLEEIVKLNAKNILAKSRSNIADLWEERITSELHQRYNYYLVCKEQLVGILLLFYVKAKELKYMKKVVIEKIKSGFMGCGNKGCCILNFEYKGKNYGFCSCHLPSGEKQKNLINRKDTFNRILNCKLGDIEFRKNDFFFIFGDLNFRTAKIGLQNLKEHLRLGSDELKRSVDIRESLFLIKKKPKFKILKKLKTELFFPKHMKNHTLDYINKLDDDCIDENEENDNLMDEKIFRENFMVEFLENEELKKFEKNDLYKYDIKESEFKFPPTYKFQKNTNLYDITKRVPSWTDRILFKNNEFIKQLEYDKIDLSLSDHKPIFGLFELWVEGK